MNAQARSVSRRVTALFGGGLLLIGSSFLALDPMASATIRTPTPFSSAGCTDGIGRFGWCIAIDGSGLDVAWVKTSGFTDQSGCSVAELLADGVVAFSMPRVCYRGSEIVTESGIDYTATMLGAEFVVNTSFRPGTQLCEQYVGTGISGGDSPKACEIIEY